jgi:2-polyprenyl-3-methyl-5-hydroxy-6-metoxy-1,4-benzoquinol methylase
MSDFKNHYRLIKTKWGFYRYDPLPSEEELNEYYDKKYYQEGCGSYELSYTDDEISYFRLKASLIYRKASRLADVIEGAKMIDIGCGEGWVINEFHQQGFSVLGVDFSRYGIAKFHPHLLHPRLCG